MKFTHLFGCFVLLQLATLPSMAAEIQCAAQGGDHPVFVIHHVLSDRPAMEMEGFELRGRMENDAFGDRRYWFGWAYMPDAQQAAYEGAPKSGIFAWIKEMAYNPRQGMDDRFQATLFMDPDLSHGYLTLRFQERIRPSLFGVLRLPAKWHDVGTVGHRLNCEFH